MIRSKWIVTLALAMTAGCASKAPSESAGPTPPNQPDRPTEPTEKPDDPAGNTGGPGEDRRDHIGIAPKCDSDYPADPFHVESARIDGDLLELTLSYGGGCELHDFFVCWPEGMFNRSNPPQAVLQIFHDSHGDRCRALVRDTRHVNLTLIKKAQQGTQGGTGPVLLRIPGVEELVEYRF